MFHSILSPKRTAAKTTNNRDWFGSRTTQQGPTIPPLWYHRRDDPETSAARWLWSTSDMHGVHGVPQIFPHCTDRYGMTTFEGPDMWDQGPKTHRGFNTKVVLFWMMPGGTPQILIIDEIFKWFNDHSNPHCSIGSYRSEPSPWYLKMGHLGSPVKLLVALGHIVQFKPYFYRSGYQPAYNLLYNLYLVNCHNCRLFCFQRCFGSCSGQRLGHKCKILRDSSGHLSRDVVKTGHSEMRTGNIHQTKVEIGTLWK